MTIKALLYSIIGFVAIFALILLVGVAGHLSNLDVLNAQAAE